MKKKIILILYIFLSIMMCFSCGAKENDIATEDNQSNDIVANESETDETSSDNNKSTQSIELEINGDKYDAFLYNNETSNKIKEKMPLSLNMQELNGNEKFAYLDYELPVNEESIGKIEAGDIMLYQNNCIVIFYKDFETSYSYTRLGKITDKSFAENIGADSIKVKFK